MRKGEVYKDFSYSFTFSTKLKFMVAGKGQEGIETLPSFPVPPLAK